VEAKQARLRTKEAARKAKLAHDNLEKKSKLSRQAGQPDDLAQGNLEPATAAKQQKALDVPAE
jgi:hypothetical protein